MLEDTVDSIHKFSSRDAIAFGKTMRTWRKLVREVIAPATYVPPMSPLDISVAMQRNQLGQAMLEITERSPLEIVTETFEDDRVRALMLYTCCMWGLDPRETGVGFFVPLLIERGMNKCYCQGGSHKLASALAREIVRAGGCILDSSQVDKIDLHDGCVSGVHLWEGRTLRSKVVVSSLDPHTTFLDLVGAENLPGDLKDSVQGWQYDKWSYATLHVASEQAPHYACGDPWVDESFMTVVGFESTDQILAHWDNVVAGKVDTSSFGGHATCQTRFDSHLSRKPGKQVSFFQMHAPYAIAGGWEKRGPELADAILARWRKAAPNMRLENVITTALETPEDIEIRLPNMRYGSIKHGDYKPIQLGCFRPNQECSSTKTPIEGLYLCGASTYPGGLVIGGPGYLAANKVLEELSIEKWWKPTPEMARYVRTYLS